MNQSPFNGPKVRHSQHSMFKTGILCWLNEVLGITLARLERWPRFIPEWYFFCTRGSVYEVSL